MGGFPIRERERQMQVTSQWELATVGLSNGVLVGSQSASDFGEELRWDLESFVDGSGVLPLSDVQCLLCSVRGIWASRGARFAQ